MVRPTCLTLAFALLICLAAMVQRAISSGPENPATGQETVIANFGDRQSQVVMPEAWPHAGDVAQCPTVRQPSFDAENTAVSPQPLIRRAPLSATDNQVQISPRSIRNRIADEIAPSNSPGKTTIPAPWPFEEQKTNRHQRQARSSTRQVQVNIAPVGSMSPWRQPPVKAAQEPISPGTMQPAEVAEWQPPADAVPFPQPLEEDPDLPEPVTTVNAQNDVEPIQQPTLPNASPLRRDRQPTTAHGHSTFGHHQANAESPARQRQSNPFRRESIRVISRHAAEHVRYGFNLAEKGAVHSAQREFVEALSIIADALEVEGEASHRAALIAGLRALDEAADFARQDKPLEATINLQRVIDVHKTPVLAEAVLEELTPYVAMQQYFAYAEQQLAYAGGGSPAASRALYGLGRIQPFLAGQRGPGNSPGGPKVIALHRAALTNDPRNHEAANELGVQLARYGQLPAEAAAFMHSLSVHPVPEAWHNLARVYEEQGDRTQAQFARARYATLIAAIRQGNNSTAGEPAIRWVNPEVFSPSSARQHIALGSSSKSPAPSGETPPTASAPSGPIQRIGRLFSRNRRR